MGGTKMNDYYTYKEIKSQIDSWGVIFDEITREKPKIGLDFFSKDYDKIVFFGCGTSYNLAMASSFFTNTVSKFESIAVPSSELIFNSETFIDRNKKYLLVGFSRSGETTESIEVINKFKKQNGISNFVFTCRGNSSFAGVSDNFYVCKKAEEKSVAMTKSFSSMLFAYCNLIAKFLNNVNILNQFNSLCNYLNDKISILFEEIEEYIDRNNFNSYFALGSGFNYALAVEADLKMKEMSQTPSYSYHIFEFNHGPKSLLKDDSLCLVLTISKKIDKADIVLNEIVKQNSKLAIIGGGGIDIKLGSNIEFFLTDADFKSDLVKSFINIPVFQILAYSKTIKENLNPDNPCNLDYTTKLFDK